jgi:uncharacterized membrane protein
MKKLDFRKITGYFIHSDERFVSVKLWRDWKIMIVGFLIFLAVAIIIDGYVFWKYKFNSPFSDLSGMAVEGKVLIFKKQTLDRVIGVINEKEKTFNEVFSTTTPLIKDPSL